MVQTILRKLPEKEARELIATIGQARSYIQNQLWMQVEASLYRLYHVENKLRELLGEQPIPRTCYHQCDIHQPVKQKTALELDPDLVYADKTVEEKACNAEIRSAKLAS